MELIKLIEIVTLSCKLSLNNVVNYDGILYEKERKCRVRTIKCLRSSENYTVMKQQ